MTHTKAWQLIEQVGWCQGQEVKRKRGVIVGYCARGAIYAVYSGDMRACWSAYGKVHAAIEDPYITQWNDAPERTKEHVVAIMKGVDV